jgi:hypothetical protein
VLISYRKFIPVKVNTSFNNNKCTIPLIYVYNLSHSSYMFRRYYLAVFRELTPTFLPNIQLHTRSEQTHICYFVNSAEFCRVGLQLCTRQNIITTKIIFMRMLHAFLRSALHGGESLDSQPRGFNPGETASDVYHTRKCLDCITGGRAVKKRKTCSA